MFHKITIWDTFSAREIQSHRYIYLVEYHFVSVLLVDPNARDMRLAGMRIIYLVPDRSPRAVCFEVTLSCADGFILIVHFASNFDCTMPITDETPRKAKCASLGCWDRGVGAKRPFI